MRGSFSHFMRDDGGSQAIEYATIASLVSIGIFSATETIGATIKGFFLNLLEGFKNVL